VSANPGESGEGILAGMRVIEIAAFVAVPLAGATLASLGADVIRVDPIGGGIDIERWPRWNDTSLYWSGLNQGKRSLTVDTRSVAGQDIVRRLIATGGAGGGVVITNLGARGWVSYESLREVRSDVILLHLQGNRDGSPAVDYTVNARMGFPLVTGADPAGPPVNHVLPAWDGMAGHLIATAVLAAERYRSRTGAGQLITLSLADVALAVVSRLGILAEAVLDPEPRQRYGNFIYGTFGKDFLTRDGRSVMVSALTPGQWHRLVRATGLVAEFDKVAERAQVDLDTDDGRWAARESIAKVLEEWVGSRDLAEVQERFDAAGVLWSPYRSFKEMADDPDATPDNPMFTMVSQPGVGDYSIASTPLTFGAAERRPASVPPRLGEHTDEILTDVLHLSATEVAALRSQGVVGEPAPH
jgi:2-methylfumaryl-CoA isomerase